MRRRKIRLALVSDDVQYARAKSVAAARGDAPNYWKNVREAERVLYGHADVEVVLSISEDDSRAFEEVRASPPADVSADFVGHELLKKETLSAAKPPIRVLPFRARIDPQTARKGWDAHAQTWASRKGSRLCGRGHVLEPESVCQMAAARRTCRPYRRSPMWMEGATSCAMPT